MKKLIAAATVLSATIVAASCVSDSPPPAAPMVPAAAGAITREQAADLLAQARCDRELRCQGIAPGARYATVVDCLNVMRRDALSTLAGCQYHVKDRELRACAKAAQEQPCGAIAFPLEWLGRAATCRPDNLCLH
jgi:hypothetical protein